MNFPAWSYSSIKLFEQCPRKYFHLRVVKDVVETETEAMAYGTLMHKVAEEYIKDDVPVPPAFKYLKPTLDNLKQLSGERLCEYKMGLTKNLEPCGFTDNKVWWRGIVDLAIMNYETGEARVVDYKTGKSAKYADTGQLELMALAMFKHFPQIKKIKAGLLFVVCNVFLKSKYDTLAAPKLWEKWLKRYSRVEAAHTNNVWNPNPSGLCHKHCAVFSCSHNGRNR